MNSKERVLTALNNEQPDRVPIMEVIDQPIVAAIAKILGFGPLETEEDTYCRFIQELGLDATISGYSQGEVSLGEEFVKNHHGMVFQRSDVGESIVVEGPIEDPEDIRGYELVPPKLDDFDRARYVMEQLGPNVAHFVSLADPFKTSWLLRGSFEHLMLDYVRRPQLVHDMARISTDFGLAIIDIASEIGAHGIFMGGDLAANQTTLVSPRHYREFIKPYQIELVNHAHQKGLKFIKHTDGNVWPILDDFVEVGFDAFHPIQPQCMDIQEVKAHLAGKMALVGNIDCIELLPAATEAEVKEAVKETIEKAAPGGGYIISSSNSVHMGVKPENYIAMVRAAHKYGVYQREMEAK
jgi:uroporphyrinogen decarboxylase